MNDTQPPDEPAPLSLGGRLVSVLASPSDAFDSIRHRPSDMGNWLMPAILLMVVGWIGTWLVLSQPEIQQQIRELAARQIESRVEAGRISPEQAAAAQAQSARWAELGSRIGGVLGPAFVAFITPFGWGLVLWLLGAKLLRGGFPYLKAVEIAGLSCLILVLESVLKTLLILVTGNLFAAPGPVLLLPAFDAQNPVHGILAQLNLTTIWVLAVRGVGIARVGALPLGRCLAAVLAFWVAWNGLWMGLGYGIRRVFE